LTERSRSVAADGSARDRCAHLVQPVCSTRCRPSARALAWRAAVARSVRRHALGPRLTALWRASGCAKLRRRAPHPRLDTELAAPGTNRRTMLRHPSAGMQADTTTARPGMAGLTCCTGGKGHPETGAVCHRRGRCQWTSEWGVLPGHGPPRPSQAPASAGYASNPGGEAEPDPGWPGRR
jgi:hypothetical protein